MTDCQSSIDFYDIQIIGKFWVKNMIEEGYAASQRIPTVVKFVVIAEGFLFVRLS